MRTHVPTRRLKPLAYTLGFALLSLSVIKCGAQEEVAGDATTPTSVQTPASATQPTILSGTSGLSPSPVPDQTVLAEARDIPFPPGVVSQGEAEIVSAGTTLRGVAYVGFYAKMSATDVLSFLKDRLTTSGWMPEGDPVYESSQKLPADLPVRSLRWSLIKRDLRLLVTADLSAPDLGRGDVGWSFTVQPIWYPAWDESYVPAPETDTTPIPIGPDSLKQ